MHDADEPLEYLDRSYADATLKQHERWEESRYTRSRLGVILRPYFGVTDECLTEQSMKLAEYDLPQIYRAIRARFSQWQEVRVVGSFWITHLSRPVYKQIEIRPGRFGNYLGSGAIVFALPDGGYRALYVNSDVCSTAYSISLIGGAGDKERITQEAAELRRWMKRHHYLRRQAVRPNGTLLHKNRAALTWEDIALTPAQRTTLIHNTAGVLGRRQLFKRFGVPQKRGILLHGPAGTGKSLVGKILAGSGIATFVYLAQVSADEPRPLAVEATMEVPLVDPANGESLGIPLLGVVDLILDAQGGPVIADFKTSSKGSPPFEVTHELQLSSYAWLFRNVAGRDEAGLEIRSIIKTKTPKVECHRYPARTDAHFHRLFAVIREYVDALDSGRFNFRPGWSCAMCDFRESHCRDWCGD